ncbi:MAG: ABC transporter permease [Candidatus Altimarinota bacterium]
MISLYENFTNSLESIRANKLRSTLSMLGIIIGVSSVIILTAIGAGSQKSIVDQVEEMGTNILTISLNRMGGVNSRSVSSDILNQNLVDEIKQVSGIKAIAPTISTNGQLIYGANNMNASVLGINSDYFSAKNVEISYGMGFTQSHQDNLDKVAIIGQTILTDLFDGEDPIGKNIKMGNNVFEVIGVIEENSTLDSVVFIPISTASIRVVGQKYFSEIMIAVENSDTITQKQEEINNALIEFLNIENTSSLPYRIRNQAEMLSNLTSITETLTMLLSGIAGISLLVGGIGVMNIMLVSVTERTKEIGIRKAIGAGKNDILTQFLTEAVTLSILGGAIGIALSFGVVQILNYFSIAAIITNDSLLLSFGFSFGIGVVFGLLPAYKASKLRPIEALRFE